jgi:hypothetical protein
MSYSLVEVPRCCAGAQCVHRVPAPRLAYSLCSCSLSGEMSQTAWHYISEDVTLYSLSSQIRPHFAKLFLTLSVLTEVTVTFFMFQHTGYV